MTEITLSLQSWKQQVGIHFTDDELAWALKDGLRRGESRVHLGRKGDTECFLLIEEERHHA